PNPSNSATGVSTTPTLGWTAANATTYDVKFDTVNPPSTQVSSAQTGTSYTPSVLTNGTTYYWQIVARNSGGTTTGPVWSFTTVVAAPGTPTSPNPSNGSSGVSTTPTLSWTATNATSYDVQFGTVNPPTTVVSNDQPGTSY